MVSLASGVKELVLGVRIRFRAKAIAKNRGSNVVLEISEALTQAMVLCDIWFAERIYVLT